MVMGLFNIFQFLKIILFAFFLLIYKNYLFLMSVLLITDIVNIFLTGDLPFHSLSYDFL